MNLALMHANQVALRSSQEAIQRQRNLQKARISDKDNQDHGERGVKDEHNNRTQQA